MSKAHNAGKPWTDDMVRELVADFDAGLGVRDIAEKQGRSGSSIVAKLGALGRLITLRNGHYYAVPETPWACWQEVRAADREMGE